MGQTRAQHITITRYHHSVKKIQRSEQKLKKGKTSGVQGMTEETLKTHAARPKRNTRNVPLNHHLGSFQTPHCQLIADRYAPSLFYTQLFSTVIYQARYTHKKRISSRIKKNAAATTKEIPALDGKTEVLLPALLRSEPLRDFKWETRISVCTALRKIRPLADPSNASVTIGNSNCCCIQHLSKPPK